MPNLKVRLPDGSTRLFPLVKRITSVGRTRDNDLAVDDRSLPESAFHLLYDGQGYNAVAHAGDLLVNGKKAREARLGPGDVLRCGDTEFRFEPPPPRPPAAAVPAPHVPFDKLHAFALELLGNYELEPLLERLMDAAIELTGAEKGFLLLVEGDGLAVKVARNLARENIEDAVERVSDSIVAEAIRNRRPVIVSDALSDAKFKGAASVVNLKLSSVMCAPLTERGTPIGLVYVGNDRVANLFDERSLEVLTVLAAQASLIVRNALLLNELRLDNAQLRKQMEQARFGELLGACQAMREVYRRIDKIASTDLSVLVTGETGTGKELIARELHRRSSRRNGPFVAINCGAIPENLLESELFGHVKGAFTGAVSTRIGKFQAAHGGTLFLDEIGEMPRELQVKLLRALQERTVVKVGDTRPEPVDIRVVSASNRDLEAEIKTGAFREDLYYRLNVISLPLPPLRERGDDVVVLAKFFLQKYAKEFGTRVRGFAPSALLAMKKYAWPGNVRELENRVKKAVVLADKAMVSADDLDLRAEQLEPILPLAQAREEWQKRYIQEVLDRNGGNRTKAAKDLGVDPRTVFRFLERLEAERHGRPPPAYDGDAD
jgi:transcriptional regulator with GAF, ATPase, and Fis domain